MNITESLSSSELSASSSSSSWLWMSSELSDTVWSKGRSSHKSSPSRQMLLTSQESMIERRQSALDGCVSGMGGESSISSSEWSLSNDQSVSLL